MLSGWQLHGLARIPHSSQLGVAKLTASAQLKPELKPVW